MFDFIEACFYSRLCQFGRSAHDHGKDDAFHPRTTYNFGENSSKCVRVE